VEEGGREEGGMEERGCGISKKWISIEVISGFPYYKNNK
jgi:hypothetical protein